MFRTTFLSTLLKVFSSHFTHSSLLAHTSPHFHSLCWLWVLPVSISLNLCSLQPKCNHLYILLQVTFIPLPPAVAKRSQCRLQTWYSGSCLTSSVSLSIIKLWADPWCGPTYTFVLSFVPTGHNSTVPHTIILALYAREADNQIQECSFTASSNYLNDVSAVNCYNLWNLGYNSIHWSILDQPSHSLLHCTLLQCISYCVEVQRKKNY